MRVARSEVSEKVCAAKQHDAADGAVRRRWMLSVRLQQSVRQGATVGLFPLRAR
jgi:hypothetical protein